MLLPTLFQIAIAYFCLLLVCIDGLLLFELPKLSPMSIYIHIKCKIFGLLVVQKVYDKTGQFLHILCSSSKEQACMNPEHVFITDYTENIHDSVWQGVCFKIVHSINHLMQPINRLMNLTNYYFDVFNKALHLINPL